MNTETNTKHAERATQVGRQLEKKAYTHDTETGKQTRNVREEDPGYYW